MKLRNESLDCLKGIAILLVMFGHVQVHNHMTDPYLYDVIKSLQMPLFMLISGYLAGRGTKIDSLSSYRQRMGKRAAAYLLPFFSWLALQHWNDISRSLHRVLFQLDYGLWFLMALFLFTWITYSAQLAAHLYRSRCRKKSGEWIFWTFYLGGCAVVLLAYLQGVTFLSPSILIIYLPYYTAAYFAGLHPELLRTCPVRIQRILAALCGLVFLAMAVLLDLVTVTGIAMLTVQTLASFLGCLALIRFVCDLPPCRLKKKIAALGRYTLEIYVLHYHFATVLNPEGKNYIFWTPAGLLYSVIAFAVMSLITTVLIYMIDRIRPLRILLFGKF